MGLEWSDLNPLTWPGQVKSRLEKDFGNVEEKAEEARRKKLLEEQAAAASDFAGYGEGGFKSLGTAADTQRARLEQIADGRLSQSREALRQGLQQQVAAQRSMAANGGPMAARTAAMNMGRAGYGMSGQAAMAGIQEQQGAMKALNDFLLQQRQQELQAALGSRQNAVTALGGGQPQPKVPGAMDKLLPVASQVLAVLASDRRLKTDIEPGDEAANKAADSLKAYTYRYKDPAYGRGEQLGIMAQELERAGLGHAVNNGPGGKTVDAGKLSGANTAMIAALARRVADVEQAQMAEAIRPKRTRRRGRSS